MLSNKKRFDFSESLSQLSIVDTQVAFKTIKSLASKFSTLVEESQLDYSQDQWKILPTAVPTLRHMMELPPKQFWPRQKSVTDGNRTLRFGLLSDFMCTMLALSYSLACVERIFLQISMINNKFTKRLYTTNFGKTNHRKGLPLVFFENHHHALLMIVKVEPVRLSILIAPAKVNQSV